ncbi:hypothetical protein MtrunA17_Chr4g0060611 [Medicago truncatula]|uniref:Uncharacterized protein n=1 Tax=Medicago truncatula TaxID=3880 RepID=A0A396IG76_MEDTR|nr:hypothetical protein MtrunA17_Chr4g0060611 [Medicago truncatula]
MKLVMTGTQPNKISSQLPNEITNSLKNPELLHFCFSCSSSTRKAEYNEF